MQLLALSLASYITPITVKTALFFVTFIFVCIGLGRRNRCGWIPLSITALLSAGFFALQMLSPHYLFTWETPALMATYALTSVFALLSFWFRRLGIVTGTLLFAVEVYRGLILGVPLLNTVIKEWLPTGNVLSTPSLHLGCLAWCLLSTLLTVIYCMIMGFRRAVPKERGPSTMEELWQASPLPMDLTLEEIMPREEDTFSKEEKHPEEVAIPIEQEELERGGIGTEILRYKHLLDEGLITAEVFREKKAELMNGMTKGNG